MPNICLLIEYDGSAYHGWQRQPGLKTVQGELERVLKIICREDIAVVHSAGRTDAGVHARGQVVNFYLQNEPELERLKLSISSLMKGELPVLRASFVPDDFHARKSAISKQYSYWILQRACPPVLDRGKVWHIPVPLDLEVMKEEAKVFIGEHDFSSFRGADCTQVSPVREIYESEVYEDGHYIVYRVVGKGFLKQMVRIMVGTLVGRGRHYSWILSVSKILERKERKYAAKTAPPQGLYLDWVKYPEGLGGVKNKISKYSPLFRDCIFRSLLSLVQ